MYPWWQVPWPRIKDRRESLVRFQQDLLEAQVHPDLRDPPDPEESTETPEREDRKVLKVQQDVTEIPAYPDHQDPPAHQDQEAMAAVTCTPLDKRDLVPR